MTMRLSSRPRGRIRRAGSPRSHTNWACSGVQLHTPNLLPGEAGYWSLAELRALRDRCDADGLAIDGLENVPLAHFWKIQRGLPGRDEQIENYCKTIRNIAAVGIDLLGYNFLATFVWRTCMPTPGAAARR